MEDPRPGEEAPGVLARRDAKGRACGLNAPGDLLRIGASSSTESSEVCVLVLLPRPKRAGDASRDFGGSRDAFRDAAWLLTPAVRPLRPSGGCWSTNPRSDEDEFAENNGGRWGAVDVDGVVVVVAGFSGVAAGEGDAVSFPFPLSLLLSLSIWVSTR